MKPVSLILLCRCCYFCCCFVISQKRTKEETNCTLLHWSAGAVYARTHTHTEATTKKVIIKLASDKLNIGNCKYILWIRNYQSNNFIMHSGYRFCILHLLKTKIICHRLTSLTLAIFAVCLLFFLLTIKLTFFLLQQKKPFKLVSTAIFVGVMFSFFVKWTKRKKNCALFGAWFIVEFFFVVYGMWSYIF